MNTRERPDAELPVVITAPAELGFAAMRSASQLARSSALLSEERQRFIIDREEHYLRQMDYRRLDEDTFEIDEGPVILGPVQSILLDPMFTALKDEARVARVKQIIQATAPKPTGRYTLLLVLYICGIIGSIALRTTNHAPLLISLVCAMVCSAGAGRTASKLHRLGVRLTSPGHIGIPPSYPTITLDEGLQLSTITAQLWKSPEYRALLDLPSQTVANAEDRVTPPPRATPAEAPADAPDERLCRIAQVHNAIKELDAEWLDYQLDLEAWFLTRPQLRNLNDPVIKKYRDADADLRDRADNLTPNSTDKQITAAEDAARSALKAWGDANRHALAIGVSNPSPSEDAALHTLHGLVGQLNDRATPKAMWPQLISAITRTMKKLTTVPFTLADIAKLPVIESESRLRVLAPYREQPDHDEPAETATL